MPLVSSDTHATGDGPLVLGVDGGATKTVAWLARSAGADSSVAVGRGQAGSGNPRAVGFAEAYRQIDIAVSAAFADAGLQRRPVEAVALALAGAGRATERHEIRLWAQGIPLASTVLVTDDAESILAAGAPDHWGIALICGTGTLAWGRNPAGHAARVGGWGYLLGDEGSAYAIARAGLRAAVRAADGRGEGTALLFRFQNALEAATPDDLIACMYHPDVTHERVASLASVVFDAAGEDEAARAIVESAAEDLADLVATLAARLHLRAGAYVLAAAGGVLLHQASLRATLATRLIARGVEPAALRLVTDPVAGAVALARRAASRGF
jgi:N-acetylglucosamine kinase-like BadF-type ATPase